MIERMVPVALSTLQEVADVAQVVIGAAAVVSVLVATYSIREIRRDRQTRVRPRLLFNRGGKGIPYEIRPLAGLPGIDLRFASAVLAQTGLLHKPGRYPTQTWGDLENHGNGSAFNAQIVFVTLNATLGGETFALDTTKLQEFPYIADANAIPASPSNIGPGSGAHFVRIPAPILVGESQGRTIIEGVVIVSYGDLLDGQYLTFQHFRCSVRSESRSLTMTFGKEYTPREAVEVVEPVRDAIPPELLPSVARPALDVALEVGRATGLVR